MKAPSKLLFLLGLLAGTASFAQAQNAFLPNDLVMLQVGDGTTTLANTGGPVSVLEYSPAGTLVQTVAVSTTATSGLQISGSAASEGALSSNNGVLSIAGYIPPFTGTGSLANRTDAQAPRGYTTVSASGVVATPTAIGAYSGNNIRGAVSTGGGTYFAGGTTGTIFRSAGVNTTIQTANINTRVVNVQNGNLYYSTGAGTQGIYGFTGTPTAATVPTAIITGVTGQGTNPYDFAFSPNGTVAYVADSTIGVQKFTLNAGVWTLAYNFALSTGVTGLAVNFSGVNPVIYTDDPGHLYSIADAGAASPVITLVTLANTNVYAFRGLDFAPTVVPEPSTLAFLAIGGCALLLVARHAARAARFVG